MFNNLSESSNALRQQLAEIKKVSLEEVGRIRMTPEKMPSLVDVGVILTGKASRRKCRLDSPTTR